MPRILFVTPFPHQDPRHGGQVRAASLVAAMRRLGWQVATTAIYPEGMFAPSQGRADDIVVPDANRERNDLLFLDYHVGQKAAQCPRTIARFRALLQRFKPDVIQLEHPWAWPLLQATSKSLMSSRIVYSSHNIEWKVKIDLSSFGLGGVATNKLIDETRLLEQTVSLNADAIISISDAEVAEIQTWTHRPVYHVPPTSSLADANELPREGRFFRLAAEGTFRQYAALMGSAYWPNVEGFFNVIPEGAGFLRPDQQIWIAGSLGAAIQKDHRYRFFQSINDSRIRDLGFLEEADKAAFFGDAACVLAPVTAGGGAKLKTVDAIASGRPVIACSNALQGYNSLIGEALGNGVYIADTPEIFRDRMIQALHGDLVGCSRMIRDLFRSSELDRRLSAIYSQLMLHAPKS